MSVRSMLVAATATAMVAISLSQADDLSPPAWRGDPGSTFQEWTFDQDPGIDPNTDSPPFIESPNPTVVNPFGSPTASIDWDPPFGTGWYDSLPAVYGGKQGWWDIATGSITLEIPNRPSNPPGSEKLIQIQVTYWDDINKAPLISISPFATQIGATTTTLVETGPVGGAWYSALSTWRLQPNPQEETITLTGPAGIGSQIDQVVVDTICIIPETSSLACAGLLALAGVWVVRRRHG